MEMSNPGPTVPLITGSARGRESVAESMTAEAGPGVSGDICDPPGGGRAGLAVVAATRALICTTLSRTVCDGDALFPNSGVRNDARRPVLGTASRRVFRSSGDGQ